MGLVRHRYIPQAHATILYTNRRIEFSYAIYIVYIQREAEKRNLFSFMCIFIVLDKLVIFFTYIKESISYKYV